MIPRWIYRLMGKDRQNSVDDSKNELERNCPENALDSPGYEEAKQELQKGKWYSLQSVGEYDTPEYLSSVRYVRREKFSKSGEWETFYRFSGGTTLSCSEGLVSMDGTLQRVRIPADSIIGIDDKSKIVSEGPLVTKLMWAPENRTPLVESWLREVEELKNAWKESPIQK